jgi:hypothetical protein
VRFPYRAPGRRAWKDPRDSARAVQRGPSASLGDRHEVVSISSFRKKRGSESSVNEN